MTNSVPLYWKSLLLLSFWGGTGGAGGGGGGPGDTSGFGCCWACPEVATEEGCKRPTSLGDPRLVICDCRWLENEGGPEDPAALPPLHGGGLCIWCEEGGKLPISAGLGSPLVIMTGCVACKLPTMLWWSPTILFGGDFCCCPSTEKKNEIAHLLFEKLSNWLRCLWIASSG